MKIFFVIMAVVIIGALLSVFFEEKTSEVAVQEKAENIKLAVDQVRKFRPPARLNPPASNLKVDTRKVDPSETKKVVDGIHGKVREMQMAHFDDYYEQVTSGWDSNIADLFLKRLNLDQDDLTFYFELKNQFESKKLETFKEFHRAKYEEYGPDYRFDQTSDELKMAIDDLKDEYGEQLREKIGEDHYRQYQSSLATYNKKIVEKSEGKTGPRILVEF